MERDILHKYKIENRSKKYFEIFILYRLWFFNFSSICDFVSQVYFGHISLSSLKKKIILKFAFEVDLSIRL
jgi:hypothetical protein